MRTKLGKLLMVVAALAACTDDGGDQEAATTTTARATTTTDAEATTTTETVPFDIEVRQAAIDLLEIRNDVFMHPDVARVSEYIADTCVCLERERGFIERFVAEGLHWEGPALGPVGISLDNADTSSPLLTLVSRQPGTAVLDSSGAIVESVPADPAAGFRVSLVLSRDGEWRLNLLEGVQLNEETFAEIEELGLP